MDKIDDGGPAFPTTDTNRPEDYGTYGMSLRDYFAAHCPDDWIARATPQTIGEMRDPDR